MGGAAFIFPLSLLAIITVAVMLIMHARVTRAELRQNPRPRCMQCRSFLDLPIQTRCSECGQSLKPADHPPGRRLWLAPMALRPLARTAELVSAMVLAIALAIIMTIIAIWLVPPPQPREGSGGVGYTDVDHLRGVRIDWHGEEDQSTTPLTIHLRWARLRSGNLDDLYLKRRGDQWLLADQLLSPDELPGVIQTWLRKDSFFRPPRASAVAAPIVSIWLTNDGYQPNAPPHYWTNGGQSVSSWGGPRGAIPAFQALYALVFLVIALILLHIYSKRTRPPKWSPEPPNVSPDSPD